MHLFSDACVSHDLFICYRLFRLLIRIHSRRDSGCVKAAVGGKQGTRQQGPKQTLVSLRVTHMRVFGMNSLREVSLHLPGVRSFALVLERIVNHLYSSLVVNLPHEGLPWKLLVLAIGTVIIPRDAAVLCP